MKVTLLLILIITVLLYIPLNRQAPKFRLKLTIDDLLPLLPWTVWIYISYYLLVILAVIFLWTSPLSIPLLATLIASTIIASLIWKIFPNGVSRPMLSDHQTINRTILKLIYHHDKDCNGFPSGHVMHAFIACYYLSLHFPSYWLMLYGLLMTISLSTLTTKQHYFFDMVATLLLTTIILEASSHIQQVITI